MAIDIISPGQSLILILLILVANVLGITSAGIIDPGQSLILLKHVAKLLGISVSYQTLLRWVQKGVGGERLAAYKIGGRRYVYLSDLQAFIDRLNAQPDRTPLPKRSSRHAATKNSNAANSSQRAGASDVEQKLDSIFGPRRHAQ